MCLHKKFIFVFLLGITSFCWADGYPRQKNEAKTAAEEVRAARARVVPHVNELDDLVDLLIQTAETLYDTSATIEESRKTAEEMGREVIRSIYDQTKDSKQRARTKALGAYAEALVTPGKFENFSKQITRSRLLSTLIVAGVLDATTIALAIGSEYPIPHMGFWDVYTFPALATTAMGVLVTAIYIVIRKIQSWRIKSILMSFFKGIQTESQMKFKNFEHFAEWLEVRTDLPFSKVTCSRLFGLKSRLNQKMIGSSKE
ncbi:MAG: hypothetical protein CL678_06335 [Bdellovibrionaceae bacterium]|nr:hypothetical protein [Pseudobdellovibrionaceae bacterium]|tara:strand:- start:7338 stop:8111 length:774 start_codon:yes stop_codon:yes gene_type:complete